MKNLLLLAKNKSWQVVPVFTMHKSLHNHFKYILEDLFPLLLTPNLISPQNLLVQTAQ